MELHLSLPRRGRLALHAYRALREAILDGRLAAGERLPSTRELAERLAVSRNTVLFAYERLVAEGLLVGNAGAGTRVPQGLSRAAQWRAPRDSVLRPRPFFSRAELPARDAAPARWDFQVGVPDSSLFPRDEWRRLLAAQQRRRPPAPGYLEPQGEERARAAIARHLAVSRSVHASAEDVLLTSGAQQAFDLIGRVLLEPGSCVAVEDPGYPPVRRLFRALGARVVPVPVDSEGLVVDALPSDARLVYVTPSHQFPLGIPMSLPRRLALLAWSERTKAAIVEDDYDSEFRFEGGPLTPLQSLDRRGRVIYVGTFSKVLLPALRMGFVIAPAALMGALREAKALSDSHGIPEPQRALAEFIQSGQLARHLRRLLRVYRQRRDALAAALERSFGSAVQQLPAVIGLHHSIFFEDVAADADAIARRAWARGVRVQPLRPYYERRPREGLALGYGLVTASAIPEGIRRLRSALVRG